ncbi:hypothetical protein Tco_0819319, partial [Tanacetum coccineum]
MSDIRAQERSDPLRPSRIALSMLCALQVYTTCIMDVSGSPDRVSDFPDGETPWIYGGFAHGPPLGTTAASEPVIEVVAPLVEEVREPVEPIVAPGTEEIVGPTEPMDAPTIGGDEDMEPLFSASDGEYDPDLYALDDDDIAIEALLDDFDMDDFAMHVDPVLAPVVPSPLMTTLPPLVAIPEPSVHEVGGSSTTADVRLPSTVEKLDTRMDDVEIRQDVLVTRVDTVRDAVTTIRAIVGEIGPRVIALEGHTQETLIYMVQDRDAQIKQISAEMVSVLEREYGLIQMIATMSKHLVSLLRLLFLGYSGLEATICIMDYGFGHDVLDVVMDIGMDNFMVNL